MKRTIPVAFLALLFVGCNETPPTEKLEVTPKVVMTNQVEKVERFAITSKGTFKAGYDNAIREIFIMKDNDTGDEYLGVTDCTVIKIKKKKDEAKAEAVESALDILGSLAEAAAD